MLGLIFAAIMSATNVFTDISRKKVLDRGYDAILISFWCKAVAFVAYGGGIVVLLFLGCTPVLPNLGGSFGLSPAVAFTLYLLLNMVLEGTAIILNLRALQVSPISLCMPFMALTPLFLLPAGKIFLGEQISSGMVVGVSLIVVGSMVVNRQLFAKGFWEPAKAIVREKGSRYMTIVALLLTFTNVLDKWFVSSGGGDVVMAERLSRAFTLSLGKCCMQGLFFAGLFLFRSRLFPQKDSGQPKLCWCNVWRDVPRWLIFAGFLEAGVLVLQLLAMQFTVAALVISIKRAGIILAVILGWFIFKERGIRDRVIASCVMLAGVLIFFLTKPDANGVAALGLSGALTVAGLALAGLTVALVLTHTPAISDGKGKQ